MIVLPGWWADDRLALWAEESEEPAEPPPQVRDHPSAIEPDLLARLLDVGSGWTGSAGVALPAASRGGPQPPPEVLRDRLPATAAPARSGAVAGGGAGGRERRARRAAAE